MGRIPSEIVGGGWTGLGARLLAVFVMLGSAGCEEEACFSWTKEEGVCPAQEEALPFFVPPGCVGGILSVESDGQFIESQEDAIPGDLCCYSVKKSSDDFAFCNGGF